MAFAASGGHCLPVRLRSGQALRILNLAAKTSETEVTAALEKALQGKTRWSDAEIVARLTPPTPKVPPQAQQTVSLAIYDALLGEMTNERR